MSREEHRYRPAGAIGYGESRNTALELLLRLRVFDRRGKRQSSEPLRA
jgi:hypothetical protein